MIYMIISVIFIIIYFYNWLLRKYDPPGPLGWPLLGSVPERLYHFLIGSNFSQSESYKNMKENYGEIWSRRIFIYREIGLASHELIYESLKKHATDFSNRPNISIFNYISKLGGITFIGGRLWKEHRKETLKIMHKLGMNSSVIEEKVINECTKLLREIEKVANMEVYSDDLYSKPIMNVICQFILNKSFEYDDQVFLNVIKNVQYIGKDENIFKTVEKFAQNVEQLENWMESECDLIEKTFNPHSDNPSCIMEHYLLLKQNIKEKGSSSDKLDLYSKHQLFRNCFDIYVAGMDTTTHMLSWCTLMLGFKTEIQDRIRKEIKDLEPNFIITIEDSKNLNYFKAFLDESFRFFPVIPRIPHSVQNKINFKGYTLKPEDIIEIDYKTISRDERVWENPNDFNPGRFMDEKNQFYKPNKYLIPFGVGKRCCMGENIARTELTIILLNVIFKFRIQLTMKTLENIDAIFSGTEGFIYAPLKHDIIYVPV